ncbi:hypothetical protein I552_0441 [Mycobacterium xenopi 3993]|nr:hypothetical protein I552_0441 [Mycobacterium xenopi 3993]
MLGRPASRASCWRRACSIPSRLSFTWWFRWRFSEPLRRFLAAGAEPSGLSSCRLFILIPLVLMIPILLV